MQTVIHVACTTGTSLRDRLGRDTRKLARVGLKVTEQKRMGRSPGWAKVHGIDPELDGAINVRWDANTTTLVCRVITRGGDPGPITGSFVTYVLASYLGRIRAISILP